MIKKLSDDYIRDAIKKEDEYEWIEGYKGTNRDMVCRDYQFTLGELHEMPKDAEIEMCSSGFHLCERLSDVFGYYEIGNGNRFFKVKALVKKQQASADSEIHLWGNFDKCVAKSIIFERELTPEEILKGSIAEHWSEEYQLLALEIGIGPTKNRMQISRLVDLGYSAPFAKLICDKGLGDIAESVGQQEDLSMDMKVLSIFELKNVVRDRGDFLMKNLSAPTLSYGTITSAAMGIKPTP